MAAIEWLLPGIGSIMQHFADKRKMSDQHQYDVDMLNRQTAASKELFDYQFDANNAYNDPKAQMQRLSAAGLNPNLVYSGNGGIAGYANNSVPVSSAHSTATGLPSSFGSAAESTLSSVLEQRKLDIEAERASNQNKRDQAEANKATEEAITEKRKRMADISLTLAKRDLAHADRARLEKEYDRLDAECNLLRKQSSKMDADIDLVKSQSALNVANSKLLDVQAEWTPKVQASVIAFNKAAAGAKTAEAAYYNAQTKVTNQEYTQMVESWDTQLETIRESLVQAKLLSKKRSYEIVDQLQETLSKYMNNKISSVAFTSTIGRILADNGFNMGAAQGLTALKDLGIALGVANATGAFSSPRTSIGFK